MPLSDAPGWSRRLIQLALPPATSSSIGARRASRTLMDGRTQEVYVEAMRPDPTLRGT